MTVHMFRACIGPNPDKMTFQQAQDAWNTWVQNHSEWTDDQTDHSLSESSTQLDGSGTVYWKANCRFLLTDAKSNLFQKLEDALQNKCEWYRIGYHECDHDESDRGGCSWGDEREWTAKDVTIPDDVPDFISQ